MVYLDNAATTYPKPEQVYEQMDWVNRNLAVNAGRGGYELAHQAENMIMDTRGLIRGLFCAEAGWDTVFTSSATFAMNQILFGLHWNRGDVVYVSPYEHNSVMRTLQILKKRYGILIKEMALKKDFTIDVGRFEYQCALDLPKCIIITVVSNVTGYILPYGAISMCAKKQGAIVIMDASQAAGLIALDMRKIHADFLVWAGHKTLYGPFGIGGYIARREILGTLDDYLIGGTGSDSLNLDMPTTGTERFEAGSHNITAIAGLHAALQELKGNKENFRERIMTIFEQEQQLSQYLYDKLSAMKTVILYPKVENRLDYVGIVSFAIKEYEAEEVGDILNDEYEIAVRTGYHCAPLIHKYLGSLNTRGTVRVSIGRFNTKEDIDLLIAALKEL